MESFAENIEGAFKGTAVIDRDYAKDFFIDLGKEFMELCDKRYEFLGAFLTSDDPSIDDIKRICFKDSYNNKSVDSEFSIIEFAANDFKVSVKSIAPVRHYDNDAKSIVLSALDKIMSEHRKDIDHKLDEPEHNL